MLQYILMTIQRESMAESVMSDQDGNTGHSYSSAGKGGI